MVIKSILRKTVFSAKYKSLTTIANVWHGKYTKVPTNYHHEFDHKKHSKSHLKSRWALVCNPGAGRDKVKQHHI